MPTTVRPLSVNRPAICNASAGRLLRECRQARGLTVPQTARLAGLSVRWVRYAERGARLSRASIARLSAALQLPTSYQDALLMTHGHTPTPPTLRRLLALARAPGRASSGR